MPDTERLRELLDRRERIKADLDDFDGDRRGHYGALEAATAELVAETLIQLPTLLDALDAAEGRAAKAEAERDALLDEGSVLAASQCLFPDGSGLVGDEYGNQICAMKARAEAAEAEATELRAENARLVEALRWAHDTLYEVNIDNYDHDEVCRLNDASVEVILGLAPILGERHGKSDEWWAARAALEGAKP
jgi:predicted  nucleic acid-binding Zn-ribbon protein